MVRQEYGKSIWDVTMGNPQPSHLTHDHTVLPTCESEKVEGPTTVRHTTQVEYTV
jgi:hypothetical protein